MDAHKQVLYGLCRFCGITIDQRSTNYQVEKFTKDSKLAFSVDVSLDDPCIHPPNVCNCCRMKLRHWRVKKNKKRDATPIPMEVVKWTPHNNGCTLCPQSEPATESTPAEGAKETANQLGIISWVEKEATIFVKWSRGGMTIERHIIIHSDNTWGVTVNGIDISSSAIFSSLPQTLCTSAQASSLLIDVFGRQMCIGNTDFQDVIKGRSTLKGVHGEVVGVVSQVPDTTTDNITAMCPTVRHVKCEVLFTSDSESTSCNSICFVCQQYRTTLFACRNRPGTINIDNLPSSSCRNDYLQSNDLLEHKTNSAQKERRNLLAQTKSLREQIRGLLEKESVELENSQDELLRTIVDDREDAIKEHIGNNEAFNLLYEEQKKALSAKDGRQNRWHPAIIRFCIAIYHKSPSAYNLMRNSQFMKLPHQETLKKYMNFTTPQVGINPDVLEFIWKDWDIANLPDYKRNVSLVFDEVKLKAGLVYSKSTGKIIGYTDLGPITNELDHFEKRLKKHAGDDVNNGPEIATQMLVMMARGIFTSMRVPVAYYPTKNASSDQLYHCVWPTVRALTVNLNLKVRAFIADGASWNRKFFSHHTLSKSPGTVTYYTKHPFLRNERLYFICDVPHLIKTTRNIWENSGWNLKSRHLHYNKQDIKWTQMLDLWKWDRGEDRTCPGFRMMNKLSEAHLYLTPSLRMRVSLASQVLSTTVANCFALQAERTGKHDTQSTQHFVRMFDKFFDCLNVRTPYQWITGAKPILKPYTDQNDERFTWLLGEFLPWLHEWEQEALQTPNMPLKERKKLCLSDQTLEGLRITVMSFVELSKDLLQEPGVEYLLSDKFNQDVLEEWFSIVRGAGGANNDPTVKELGHIHLKLLIAGSNAVASTKSNCHQHKRPANLDATPLPSKKQKKTVKVI